MALLLKRWEATHNQHCWRWESARAHDDIIIIVAEATMDDDVIMRSQGSAIYYLLVLTLSTRSLVRVVSPLNI